MNIPENISYRQMQFVRLHVARAFEAPNIYGITSGRPDADDLNRAERLILNGVIDVDGILKGHSTEGGVKQ